MSHGMTRLDDQIAERVSDEKMYVHDRYDHLFAVVDARFEVIRHWMALGMEPVVLDTW